MDSTLPPSLHNSLTLEYILLGDLRDLLEDTPDEQTGRWLTAVIDALLKTLPDEIAVQSRDGYLHEVLEENPNWEPQVEHLRREKVALFQKLQELRDGIGHPERYTMVAAQVQISLRDWMHAFTAHHRHERRIFQQAFTVDFGGGD